ncbi:MAG TPA: hypothetical protein VMJ34_15145 [Bryobacteraceae bacterium]|nr:hypothetical protein [Bryobacteraceae bacterium]
MRPDQLQPRDFRNWAPRASEQATNRIALLRHLPLSYISLLFRELIEYDWKFPAERDEIDRQFTYLERQPAEELVRTLRPFADLQLSDKLEHADWINAPARFSEELSAHLWATHQMDSFRRAATEYIERFNAAVPEAPPPVRRLCIVLVGLGVKETAYVPFEKVRREGTFYADLDAAGAWPVVLSAIERRAAAHPVRYGHWLIEGTSSQSAGGLTCVAWDALAPVRSALRNRIRQGFESRTGPEALRTLLAETGPDDVGLKDGDPVLNRFQLALFTEGSGTQIFSTTFAQWAAREALRRARPLTMAVRFAPRTRDYSMEELLSRNESTLALDPEGALRDADMGAWYTLLNLRRLSNADQASFLVCFEGHRGAVAIGPDFKAGADSRGSTSLEKLLAQLV